MFLYCWSRVFYSRTPRILHPRNDVFSRLKSNGTPKPLWHKYLTLARDVASALEYLHTRAKKIIHRDVKAENVLVSQDWRAKLTGFGLSRTVGLHEGDVMTQIGTPYVDWRPCFRTRITT